MQITRTPVRTPAHTHTDTHAHAHAYTNTGAGISHMLKSAAIFKRLTKNVVCILYRFKHTHAGTIQAQIHTGTHRHTHTYTEIHWQGAHCVGVRKFICHCGYFSVFCCAWFVLLLLLFLGAQHFCPSFFLRRTHFSWSRQDFFTQCARCMVFFLAPWPTPLLAKTCQKQLVVILQKAHW